MAVSIKVQYYKSEIVPPMQSYDLRLVVVSATDMPKEIFVFQRAPNSTAADDKFICIADPVDLEEFPINTPDLLNEMPYYRKSEVTLRFRDMTTLEETRNLIAHDIEAMVLALKAAAAIPLVEEIVYA